LPIAQKYLASKNLLYQYAPNVEVFHCPGDRRLYLPHVNRGWAYDSYSKTQNAGGEDWSPTTAAYWGTGATYNKLSTIDVPSQTFILIEDAGNLGNRGYNVGTWAVRWSLGPPQSFKFVDPVPMYHGNVSTFAFADGHAEHHKWMNPTLITKGKQAASGINVTSLSGISGAPTTSDDPDYAYVYNGYRHPNWKPSP
jgi:prepilin-type processing-associated H-X9-DG protein